MNELYSLFLHIPEAYRHNGLRWHLWQMARVVFFTVKDAVLQWARR